MPTATPGRPDRSGSGSEPDDELDLDAAGDDLAGDDVADADRAADADDEAADLDDDDLLDENDDEADDLDEGERRTSGTTTLTKTRAGSSTATRTRPARKTTKGARPGRPRDQRTGNPFVALARFIREVVGEMRKVLWPTRRELVIYTIAVIIFVSVMIAIVGGLDFGFARLILFVFG